MTSSLPPSKNPTPKIPIPGSKPISYNGREGRDVSTSSREGLRRHILHRRQSLTAGEHSFLENLAIYGNEIEVQLAIEKLSDEALFFDDTRDGDGRSNNNNNNRTQNSSNNNDNNENNDNNDNNDKNCDNVVCDSSTNATATEKNSSVPVCRAGVYDEKRDHYDDDEEVEAAAAGAAGSNTLVAERPTLTGRMGSGSCRRLQCLESRKSNNEVHGQMWKAHENGLGITKVASRRSLMVRQLSAASASNQNLAAAAVGSPRQSLNSRASLASFLNGYNMDCCAAATTAAGRVSSPAFDTTTTPRFLRHSSNVFSSAMASNCATIRAKNRILPFRRCKSLVQFQPPLLQRPRIPSPIPFGGKGREVSDSALLPPSGRMTHGRRKSVTFSASTKEPPEKSISNVGAARVMKRSISDPIGHQIPKTDDSRATTTTATRSPSPLPPLPPTPTSTMLDPDVHQQGSDSRNSAEAGTPTSAVESPIVTPTTTNVTGRMPTDRDTAFESIPCIQRATVIRSDSTATGTGYIPSIHPATAIRSDSVLSGASFPIIQHARHVWDRRNSVTSSISGGYGFIAMFSDDDKDSSDDNNDSIDQYQHRTSQSSQYDISNQVAQQWVAASTPLSTSDNHHNTTVPLDVTIQVQLDEEDQDDCQPTRYRSSSTLDNSTTEKSEQREDRSVSSDRVKPYLLRLASRSNYDGQGFEVFEMKPLADDLRTTCSNNEYSMPTDQKGDHYQQHSHDEIFRNIRKSLSADEDISNQNFYFGSSFYGTTNNNNNNNNANAADISEALGASWDMDETEASGLYQQFDTWNVVKDDFVIPDGGNSIFLPTLDFRILGTSANDKSATPHVLSPPLMESLQSFLPYSISGENFYLKYSLVRDGASLLAFLKSARGAPYTIIAIETIDGEVFGSFTGQTWRKTWNYFGTGESFLWKMRQNRIENKCTSILEQAQLESEIDVYPYTGQNTYVQLCTSNYIAVGGGAEGEGDMTATTNFMDTTTTEKKYDDDALYFKAHEYGFGLSIQEDLLEGTSSPCMTFGNPSLSDKHSDGSLFEIMNLELWTLTPCWTEKEAEQMELGRLFLGEGL